MEHDMSYRLITKALFSIADTNGKTTSREVEVRAYAAPKRDAVGQVTINGDFQPYKRTGGKGRGTADRRYMYFPFKHGDKVESAYIEITEAEATALAGGVAKLDTIVAKVEQPTEQPKTEATEQPKVEQGAKRVKAKA
jgi:hypothetical protein